MPRYTISNICTQKETKINHLSIFHSLVCDLLHAFLFHALLFSNDSKYLNCPWPFHQRETDANFTTLKITPPTITQTYFIRVIGQFERAIFGWSRSDDGRHRLFGSTLVKINDWSTNSPWKTRENRRERRSLLEGARTSFDTRKFFTTTRRNRFANSRKKIDSCSVSLELLFPELLYTSLPNYSNACRHVLSISVFFHTDTTTNKYDTYRFTIIVIEALVRVVYYFLFTSNSRSHTTDVEKNYVLQISTVTSYIVERAWI